jgi:hypothetical protein
MFAKENYVCRRVLIGQACVSERLKNAIRTREGFHSAERHAYLSLLPVWMPIAQVKSRRWALVG